MAPPSSGEFSQLLLEGLDYYRKGKMMEAVRAWEAAYRLEPTNLRAREFLRSALERIHAHMGAAAPAAPAPAAPHPWLPPQAGKAQSAEPAPSGHTLAFASPPAPAQPPAATPPGPHGKPSMQRPAPSPWDDGPSIALPQPQEQGQFAGDEASGAWSIHKEPLPIEAVASDETDIWMSGARELVALNDFSGALELARKTLEREPAHKEAQQIHELCEHNLTLMYESKIGAMDSRPAVAMPPDEIIWLNLDPRAGFVLAQIDGEVSFDDLYAICGLRRLDTARILSQLLEEGVVRIQGAGQAVAKRALHRR